VKGTHYPIEKGDALRQKGTWQRANSSARVCCPDCGVSACLEETHRIDDDGVVQPSIVCECGFHEICILIDWGE